MMNASFEDRTPTRWRIVLLLGVVHAASLIFATSGHSQQSTDDVIRLPAASVRNDSGLQVQVTQLVGYSAGARACNVWIHTSNGNPSPRDRQLTVQFELLVRGDSQVIHRESIVLPKGERSVKRTAVIPQSQRDFTEIEIRVFEGSNEHVDLFAPAPDYFYRSYYYYPVETNYSWLVISSDVDSDNARLNQLRQPGRRFADSPTFSRSQINALAGLSQGVGSLDNLPADALHPEDVPEQWTAFSSFDALMIAEEDLRRIARRSPEAVEAIVDWWRTGRFLVITIDPSKELDTSYVDELFRGGNGGDTGAIDWIDDPARLDEWKEAHPEFRQDIQFQETIASDHENEPPYRIGYSGYSSLVVSNASLGNSEVWREISRATSLSRQMTGTAERTGYDTYSSERRYSDWLIPDVGLPPVNTFRFLITLFVIIIGPVNYFILWRMRRLSLMLITVPSGALFICFALLLYAFLADGVSVQSRVMSYTVIDQRQGSYVSWSRQSHYSPFLPSDGMRFPDDALVEPIVPDERSRRRYQTRREDGWLYMVGGNTGVRTTSQFMVTRSSHTSLQIEIESNRSANDTLQAVNGLGVDIEEICVVDEDGEFYVASNVDRDEAFTLEHDPDQKFFPMISNLIRQRRPEYPPGVNPYYATNSWRSPGQGANHGYDGAGQLGRHMIRTTELTSFTPNTYWIVARRCPFVERPVKGAVERSSLHVIMGRW